MLEMLTALQVGLLFGTLASASVGHKSGTALEPLARGRWSELNFFACDVGLPARRKAAMLPGPLAAGYGEVSAADGKSFNDLPLNFQVTAGSPYSGPPVHAGAAAVAHTRWLNIYSNVVEWSERRRGNPSYESQWTQPNKSLGSQQLAAAD